MQDPKVGLFEEIFNSNNASPSIREFIVKSVTPQSLYKFKLKSQYLNGYTDESPEAEIYSCTVPSNLDIPSLKAVTSSSMTLTWK